MNYNSLCKLKTAIAEEITRNPVVKSLAHLFTLIRKCEDNSLLLSTYPNLYKKEDPANQGTSVVKPYYSQQAVRMI
jgi:hypothetical protein